MHHFGSIFGYFVYFFIPIRKGTAKVNIQTSFPEKSREEIGTILVNMYKHFGKMLMDFFRFPFLNRKKLENILRFSSSAKTILESHTKGIIISAHYGNWEMIPHIFALSDLNICAVARPQKNPGFDRFINWIRKSTGSKLISSRAPIKEMMNELAHNFLLIIGDQRGTKHGVNIDFFGKSARSPKGFCVFHIKTGAPIYFATITMDRDGIYNFDMEKLTIDVNESDMSEKIKSINQKYHHMLEETIRKHPEQYFWFHRKWL